MDKAWKALGVYMRELIAARRSAIDSTSIEAQTEKGDLFTRLIEALDEDARIGLEESEVVSSANFPVKLSCSIPPGRLAIRSP